MADAKQERVDAKKEKEWVQSCKLVPDSCLPSIKLLTARWQDLHIYGQSALGGHGDASKADTELCEALSGIFTSSAISTISKYASLLPLSTPAVPNEPELTALMQPVARRKLQPSCA